MKKESLAPASGGKALFVLYRVVRYKTPSC